MLCTCSLIGIYSFSDLSENIKSEFISNLWKCSGFKSRETVPLKKNLHASDSDKFKEHNNVQAIPYFPRS